MQTDEERHEQIEKAIDTLPKMMEQSEVVALLCTIADDYGGSGGVATAGGMKNLVMSLEHMLNIRNMLDEKSSNTLQ